MPSYFYHVKLELYPAPDQELETAQDVTATNATSSKDHAHPRTLAGLQVYLPPRDSDIFTHPFPSHRGRDRLLDYQRASKGREGVRYDSTYRDAQNSSLGGSVIDCGPQRTREPYTRESNSTFEILREGEDLEALTGQLTGLRGLGKGTEGDLLSAKRDWRFGEVGIVGVDMIDEGMDGNAASINAGPRGKATKGSFEVLERETEVGWGVVRLYRDGEETEGLWDEASEESLVSDEDCTILCIPAVPSYMTPSDFLGWVGEDTRELVSHFRMVMTGRMNRYLVLLKFRDGKEARKWRREWDGKVFNSMEPENCHVMFIKSIIFQTPKTPTNEVSSPPGNSSKSFPDMTHDPFTPTTTLKPFPPPTPSLVELPTCPVCLERMDDTTGLLTILCQHVFHCACLQKWKGSGCPVCRHTQPSPTPFGNSPGEASLCRVCDCDSDLWICLICGNVGCGRYKGGHAKEHWKESGHNYSLEIETQHVWDYAGDLWVHRLIQTKGDGKLVELPDRSDARSRNKAANDDDYSGKIENIGLEYTHLLTSQLESQRVYFEDIVKKAADKASAASAAAESAAVQATDAMHAFRSLQDEHASLVRSVAELEKERNRAALKAEKTAEMARKMTAAFQEEKSQNRGLLDRVRHVSAEAERLAAELQTVRAENSELQEMNRDLGFFISSSQKVQELKDADGELAGEIEEGTVGVGKKGKGRRK